MRAFTIARLDSDSIIVTKRYPISACRCSSAVIAPLRVSPISIINRFSFESLLESKNLNKKGYTNINYLIQNY